MMRRAERRHVSPTTGEHLTDGLDCWCSPRYATPCDECDGDGCWKCIDGLITLTRIEVELSDVPLIIVHNR